MELQDIRKQLDQIDDQVTCLFLQRMALSAQAAAYKREKGLPILDAEREQQILSKVAKQAGENMGEYILKLYQTLFSVSRAYQARLLGREADGEQP